jgi:hypothetical protein
VNARRRPGTFSDVLRTVAVMAAILLLIAIIDRVFRVDPAKEASGVDPAQMAAGAAARAGVPLYAPKSLPDGWRATSAELRGEGVWHVGVVTRGNDYIGLEQAKASTGALVRQFAKGSRADGSVQISGEPWSRRTEADGDTV